MMGAAAVAVVVACAALYTALDLIERRKRRRFEEHLRRSEERLRRRIKEYIGDWDDDESMH